MPTVCVCWTATKGIEGSLAHALRSSGTDAIGSAGLHTVYLIFERLPCLNNMKRFEKSCELAERALEILSTPEFHLNEDTNQLKVSARPCCGGSDG